MKKRKIPGVTLLGKKGAPIPASPEKAALESFKNPSPDRDYSITLDCPEFTSLCPVTGQPDFGHLTINYVPDKKCIESKSLKLYLFSFRDNAAFHEEAVNMILNDAVKAVQPRSMTVKGAFRPRGGISITVEASHRA